MTFKEVLAQVIEWLQQDKRLSYRALKRQFALDDAYLDDLKAELIEVRRVAVEEDGRVLVWTSGADAPPSPSLASSSAHQPVTQEVLPPSAPPLAVPSSSGAERRQLTVLFCDLVDSTVLAGQLDPEELREVVQAYQATCGKVIARFEGHIAQYLGDGLLVYFGYPLAHEDDAQRAVRAGLGIVEAVGQLNTHLEREREVQLAVRLGIHTGLVVVGPMGDGTRQEQLALGETPNIAARLQGIAAPNTLVISAATFQLLGGFFACQSVGTRAVLKGEGFAPGAPMRLVWETAVGSRVTENGFTPQENELGEIKADGNGRIDRTLTIPDDLGGLHGLAVRRGDDLIARAHFVIETSLVDVSPRSGPAGTPVTIHLKGVGWTAYDNIYVATYDNAYMGYACGFNSHGDVVINFTATGEPGPHVIDLYPGIYQGPPTEPQQLYRLPQLTYADDHPGNKIPAIRLLFEITPLPTRRALTSTRD